MTVDDAPPNGQHQLLENTGGNQAVGLETTPHLPAIDW